MTDQPVTAGDAESGADDAILRPNPRVLLAGAAAAALLSFAFLPATSAIAASWLGALMIAGAEVDARALLLPDAVTLGAAASGLAATFFLARGDPWTDLGVAALRAAGAALALFALREIHRRLRGREGLGLGDVKLASAIGAWLPLGLIPLCFALAASAALATVALRACRERVWDVKTPFGAFLCPALWLVFFISALPP